jgi:DNA-binding MarR family transcriptional regulator
MQQPSEAVVAAWIGLLRAQAFAFAEVERMIRDAGLPKLEWYDVLWELERGGSLRPRDLQARLLFAQYNLSRLLDRMETADLITRDACPEDNRGQLISITDEGRKLRCRMWLTYGPAIDAAIKGRLTEEEAGLLAALLSKLVPRPAGPAGDPLTKQQT